MMEEEEGKDDKEKEEEEGKEDKEKEEEEGWAGGGGGKKGGEPQGIWSPNCPAHSKSLYQLCFLGPPWNLYRNTNVYPLLKFPYPFMSC
jgi:hypothetical protein